VTGVSYLDNIMYVVCAESPTIRLYSTKTLGPLDVVINVKGMRNPRDIVVCRHDRQLYVAEEDCIWRVKANDHSYIKWLNTQFSVQSLSLTYQVDVVTSRHLLVTSWPPAVRQYNTTNKQLLRVIRMPRYVKDVFHATETTHGTFVVCHYGTSQDWLLQYYAVSVNC